MTKRLDENGNRERPRATKKPYVSPSLVVYGSVAKVTAGVGGSHSDAGQANVTKHGVG